MKRFARLFLAALWLLLSFSSLLAQELPTRLEILDLETFPKNPVDFLSDYFTVGEKLVFTTDNGDHLTVLDKQNIDTTFTFFNGADLLGTFNSGVLFQARTDDQPNPEQTFFLDPYTLEVTSLFDWSIRDISFFSDRAFVRDFDDNVFVIDGTLDGTQLLYATDGGASGDKFIGQIGEHLVFTAEQGIWVTDGTPAGTKEIVADEDFFILRDIEIVGDQVYFVGTNGSPSYETLASADVTTGEVNLVKVFEPNSFPPKITGIYYLQHAVTFIATTEETGYELWITDGTSGGTSLLMDIAPGATSGIRSERPVFTAHGILYFRGGSDDSHNQVWRTDGTETGTYPILSFEESEIVNTDWSISNSRSGGGAAAYFFINLSSELSFWFSDGINDAIELPSLSEVFAPTSQQYVYATSDYDFLFFREQGSSEEKIWSLERTTGELKELLPASNLSPIGVVNDQFLFEWESDDFIGNLFASDGTLAGTGSLGVLFYDGTSLPYQKDQLFELGDTTYFFVSDTIHGQSLYQTDGTNSGTTFALDLYPHNLGADPQNLIAAAGFLFFTRQGELWSTDGTLAGTKHLDAAVNTGASRYYLGQYLGKLFFVGTDYSIWCSDGSKAGTEQVSPPGLFEISPIYTIGSYVYFRAYTQANGLELWRTDGTLSGTEIVFESRPGAATYHANRESGFAATRDLLLFGYSNEDFDTELYSYDPETEALQLVKDVIPGEIASYPTSMIPASDCVLFSINPVPTNIKEVWTTDGTPAGTTRLLEETLAYDLHINIGGRRLIRTDSGTLLTNGKISDTLPYAISREEFSSGPEELTKVFYDNVIFRTNHPEYSYEPWISDGSTTGINLLKDINLNGRSDPEAFTPTSDWVFFIAEPTGSNSERQLFYTGGTPETTDLLPIDNLVYRNPRWLTQYRDRVYFVADNPIYGREIMYLDLELDPGINGIAFEDLNADGLRDPDEPGIYGLTVSATDDREHHAFTGEEGAFEFYLNAGTYQVEVPTQTCWEPTSEPGSYTVEVGDETFDTLYFGFRRVEDYADVRLVAASAPTRCGFTVPYWLHVYNTGCRRISGEVEIQLPQATELVSVSPEPLSNENGLLRFDYADLAPAAFLRIDLQLIMPDETFVGNPVDLTGTVFYQDDSGNLQAGDDLLYASELRCAIDPNDKLVHPARREASKSNYTQLDETLRYTIRFQNTGNDTAFTVRITDTLSADLDWSTFQPLVASHPYRATLSPDGVAEFLFPDILLPDSNVNEPLSHGFVIFEINLQPNLADFSEVSNKANIYFDFNQPVITPPIKSTVVEALDPDNDTYYFWEDCDETDPLINPGATEIDGNTVDENCDGQLTPTTKAAALGIKIYPNPTRGQVTIELGELPSANIRVSDLYGRVVLPERVVLRAGNLDLSSLPAGMYLLEVFTPSRNSTVVTRVEKF